MHTPVFYILSSGTVIQPIQNGCSIVIVIFLSRSLLCDIQYPVCSASENKVDCVCCKI